MKLMLIPMIILFLPLVIFADGHTEDDGFNAGFEENETSEEDYSVRSVCGDGTCDQREVGVCPEDCGGSGPPPVEQPSEDEEVEDSSQSSQEIMEDEMTDTSESGGTEAESEESSSTSATSMGLNRVVIFASMGFIVIVMLVGAIFISSLKRKKQSEIDELVRAMIAQGNSKEYIVSYMRGQGINEKQIENAMKNYRSS